ncbi:MAG: hypothetical protein ABR949_05775 [Candidatus Aquilonibacter sp.]|jgi:hypothetical protein
MMAAVIALCGAAIAALVATLAFDRADRTSRSNLYQKRLDAQVKIQEAAGPPSGGAAPPAALPPPPATAPSTLTALSAMITLVAFGVLIVFALPIFHQPIDVPVPGCDQADRFHVPSGTVIGRSVVATLTSTTCRNATLFLNGTQLTPTTVSPNAMYWTFTSTTGQQLLILTVPKPHAKASALEFDLAKPATGRAPATPPAQKFLSVAGCTLAVTAPPELPAAGAYAIDIAGFQTCPQLAGPVMLYINGAVQNPIGTSIDFGSGVKGNRYVIGTSTVSPQRIDIFANTSDVSVATFVISGSDAFNPSSLLQSATSISGFAISIIGVIGVAITLIRRPKGTVTG